MMKIAFVVNSITDNGVTKVLSILLDHIDYDKYDVTVVLTRHRPRKRDLNQRAEIIEAQQAQITGLRGKISEILGIRKIVKREQFELVVVLGNFAAMYTLIATSGLKVKKIISERNDPNREPAKKAYRKLRDMLYRSADVIVCQTTDASQYYRDIVSRRVVIANPINDSLPFFVGMRDKRVVNFCRIDGQKNLPLLIDSFQEFVKAYPDYSLEIYGDGPLRQEIADYITNRNLTDKVQLKDFCLDIHRKIAAAGMFVSSSDFEGMSNSMLEALAIGIPTICTDCPIGGAREIIETGKNGILVPIKDKAAMVQAMKRIANDPNFADKIAAGGSEIRKTLSAETICNQWWELFEEQLKR